MAETDVYMRNTSFCPAPSGRKLFVCHDSQGFTLGFHVPVRWTDKQDK